MSSRFANRYDSHIHSLNSHDGRASVNSICEAAIKSGLCGIALTDHCDAAMGTAACVGVKDSLMSDVKLARERYGDRLAISMGIELGEPHHDQSLTRELTSDPDLDFVIGSLHRLRGEEDFYFMDLNEMDMSEIMPRYYDELEEMAETGMFDVFGHINYHVRYMEPEACDRLDLASYYERLEKVLAVAAKNDLGIEINTSGLRRRKLNDILPSQDVIELFVRVGGAIVTIGTDSHDADTVGAGVSVAMEKLLAVGIDCFAFFEGRCPTMHGVE